MQACYAMGYNLAIEYLADYEKTWMLDSFRALNERVLVPQQRGLSQWLFLEVKSSGPHTILPFSAKSLPMCHVHLTHAVHGCKSLLFLSMACL